MKQKVIEEARPVISYRLVQIVKPSRMPYVTGENPLFSKRI